MATIYQAIALKDGVSKVLTGISNSISETSANFHKMGNAAGAFESITTGAANSTASTLNASASRIARSAGLMSSALAETSIRMRDVGESAQKTSASISGLASKLGNVKNGLMGTFSGAIPFAIGNLISEFVMRLVELPRLLIGASDQFNGIIARLRIITSSQEKAVQMNDLIFQSAQRAHGSYEAMAESVAQIAMMAKDAFPDAKDVIPFMEGIQKIFAISKTSMQQQQAAMLQLSQALASGRLQGDEFRSIAEAAPMIEQYIAEAMGVSRGELKQLASEGKVTAEVIREAIFTNMGDINDKFKEMGVSWSERFIMAKDRILKAFQPVFAMLARLANSKFTEKFAGGIVAAFEGLSTIVKGIGNNIEWLYGVMSKLGLIEPIVAALATAMALYAVQTAWATAASVAKTAANVAQFISENGLAAAIAEVSGALGLQSISSFAATVAQEGLNVAMYACPATWLAIVIMALVGVFYLAVAAVNHFAGTTVSATGLIFAYFAWLFTSLVNQLKVVANMFIAFAEFIFNVFVDPLQATQNLFAQIWSGIVDYVAAAVQNIVDLISKIPGIGKVGLELPTAAEIRNKLHAMGPQYQRIAKEKGGIHFDQFDYTEGWVNGAYNAGDNLGNWVQENVPGMSPGGASGAIKDAIDGSEAGKGAKDTAGNTGRMAEAMEASAEDLKYLRDIAEQEAINRYTTASVNIEMGGITNNVGSDMDLDGMVNYIAEGLTERMQIGAEKVQTI